MSLDVSLIKVQPTEVFTRNITHNLAEMAEAVGIYKHLWRPDEIGIIKARELIEPLQKGLERLRTFPETFKQYNPENGWGSYEGLIRFTEEYLAACEENPDATVEVDR